MHPQQTRKKIHRKATFIRYLFAPIFLLLFLIKKIVSAFGKEGAFLEFMFRKKMDDFVEQKAKGFENYQPTANDVFACCYSKSGTNWILQIVTQIANKGKAEFENIHDVVPWPHNPFDGFAVPLDHELSLNTLTGKRAIKTNCELKYVPYEEKAKYICLLRDPKSVFVSGYHFVKTVMMGPMMPAVSVWLDLFLSDVFFAGQWAEYADDYWNWRNRPNVLFLTFEEMKEDLEGTISKIADFMEVQLSTEEYQQVCHLSSYQYMKSVNEKFYPGRIFPLGSKTGSMIRSGKKGNSDELINKAQQKRIDAYFLEALKKRNSDFPYKEYYM